MKACYIYIYRWIGGMGKFTVLVLILTFLIASQKVFAATTVDLGTADGFSVLAALSMSAAAPGTTISGNLGLSTNTASSRTGNWRVGGMEYFGPLSLAATAHTDALGAFNNLAGQTSDGTLGAWGGAVSLVPGVWTEASDTTFTGTLTLSGGYNDVWVFQIGRDMTFSGSVVMAGNAQPCHVFWQIGRDATIASGSTFVGTLIASRDVTLVSGATINGRVISLNSSLTTDGNTISGPTCAAAPTSTPTSTPTSSSAASSGSNESSSTGTAVYPALSSTIIAPSIIESKRVDTDSIFISWGPYSGADTFNVQYGTENGKWLYNTNVNGFSTTISALPPNQPIWVRIAARNIGLIGTYGESKLVGGPSLPNTGFDPGRHFSKK